MSGPWWRGWRRDVIVGSLAALLTAGVLVPLAWASHRSGQEQAEKARNDARAAARLAEEKAAEAERQRNLAHRALVQEAAEIAGLDDKAGAEVLRVSTDAVSPEVPKDAWLLIDKKASSWTPGDIVVFRQGELKY